MNWKLLFNRGTKEWNRAVVIWVALGAGLATNLFSLYFFSLMWFSPKHVVLFGEPDLVILGLEVFLATVFVGLSVLGLVYFRGYMKKEKMDYKEYLKELEKEIQEK